MRHQGAYRKFSRTPAHRKAMFRNLATTLVEREKFETTVQKAKDLRRVVEKLVTLAGTDNLSNRRLAAGFLRSHEAVQKLFTEIAPRFKDRRGGYTRVIRTRVRPGDAAEMAVIEFLTEDKKSKSSKSAAKAKSPKSKAKKQAKSEPAAEA